MPHGLVLLSTSLVVALGLGAATAQAAPNATLNQCWGDVTSQFAQLEPGAMGEHSNAHSPVTTDPGEGGRNGVANQGRIDGDGEPGDGGQGRHAIRAGGMMGLECEGAADLEEVP